MSVERRRGKKLSRADVGTRVVERLLPVDELVLLKRVSMGPHPKFPSGPVLMRVPSSDGVGDRKGVGI